MLKKWALISSIALSVFLFLSCSENNTPTSSTVIQDKNLVLSFVLPDAYKDSLSKAVAVISAPGIDTILQQLSFEMARVYGTVTNVPLGHKYHIEIKIYNKKGLIIYNGDAFTEVSADKTIDVIIKLKHVAGSVNVIGIIDDEPVDTTNHNISGCWKILQSNGYSGSLQLTQVGTTIKGVSNWATHSNGPISGTIISNKLSFTITYPEGGGIGYYFATVGSDIKINGPAWSSTLDTVTWSAARIDCTPVSIAGCWSINQSNAETGSLQFTQEGSVVKGVSNWTTHSNGPISGTLVDNSLSFTITYNDGVTGYYYATVSENGNAMVNCYAKSSSGDTITFKVARTVCITQ